MISPVIPILLIQLAQCPRYSFNSVSGPDCGISGLAGALAEGVSEDGWVCGWFANCVGYERPFYWPAGGGRIEILLPLPYGPFGGARAMAIESSFVVGHAEVAGSTVRRAFRFAKGSAQFLEALAGDTWTEALAVNAQGVAAGMSGGKTQRAVFWTTTSTAPTALSLPVGPSALALGINADGDICGWMGVAPVPGFTATAFLWRGGIVTNLGIPPGATATTANDINEHGDACGYALWSTNARGFPNRRPCAWINGEFVDLGTLPGLSSGTALDINDAGEIIGYCNDVAVGNTPFIWRNGVMSALNDLVPPDSPLLEVSWAINDRGQIAGEGIVGPPDLHSVAFLLTPALPAHAGDTDCDNQVNINDLLNVINHWNPPGPVGGEPADLNRDNKIDVWDLLEVILHWG